MKRKMQDALRAPKLVGAYEKHQEIGRGTYGTVYAGVRRSKGVGASDGDSNSGDAGDQRVAIKKVLGRVEAGKREAAFLQRCRDARHVVQLLDVVERNDKLYLVLEYMASDLEAVIKDTDAVPQLPIAHIKTYLRMLLTGVQELHARNILHRDLKPNNVLLSTSQCTAKITDFGMATTLDTTIAASDAAAGNNSSSDDQGSTEDAASCAKSKPKRSLQVVTRAYRAPELFFGHDAYGAEVDVWSVGCIFGELLLRKPLFDGASDIDQLSRIFQVLGSPLENGWRSAAALPFYLRFKDTHPPPLREQVPTELSDAGVALLRALLQLDPAKRISIDAALAHVFFTEAPLPADPSELVVPEDPQRVVSEVPVVAAAQTRASASSEESAAAVTAAEVVVLDSDRERAFMIKGRRLL